MLLYVSILWIVRIKDSILTKMAEVLEHSSIAWPNPNMWIQEGSVESLWSSMRDSERRVRAQDETTHGHSPIRSEPRLLASSMTLPNSSHDMAAWATGRAFPIPTHHPHRLGEPPLWGFGAERYDPSFGKNGLDAFVSEEAWTHRGARSSHEDVPMPDYSISSGSRAISSMTGVSYEHSKQPSIEAILDEDQYNELLQALTPTKAPVIGTRAPSNTPSAVPVTTPTNMPAPAKPSGAPEVRLHRRTRGSARGLGSGRASALREVSQPSTRDVSGSSNRSNIPPEKTTTPSKATPPANFGISPSANVKGKKEGPNENIKISPKRTPQKDAIGATSQDGKLNDDRNPGEKEQENAVHEDEDVISACII